MGRPLFAELRNVREIFPARQGIEGRRNVLNASLLSSNLMAAIEVWLTLL